MNDKKQLVCDSAIKLISKLSYQNVRVQAIADHAKVSVGTIYNYFTSKEEIVEYIIETQYNKRLAYIKTLDKEDISPLNKIIKYLEFCMDDYKEHRDLGKVLAIDLVAKHVDLGIKTNVNEIYEELEKLFEKAANIGELQDINIHMMTSIVMAMMRGCVYTDEYNSDDETFDYFKNAVISIIVNGVKVKNP